MLPTNRRGALALFVCLLTTSVSAQVNPYEGKTIAAIEYAPAQVLDPTDLAKAQPLKKGEPLRARDVANAIDGLFATGRFEDIAVEAEPVAEGVVVRFRTKPQWFVGGVNVEGKTALPPNRGEIESTTRFTLGAPFREEDINHAIDSMTRLLKSNGFYDAAITPQVEHGSGTQEVFITFQIREGKRASYEEPEFHGNTTTTAPLVSDSTILRATGWRLPIIHWWRQVTADRTSNGVEKVRLKYEKQDRLLAGVEVKRLDYDAGRRRVRPSLNIDPGPRLKVEAVEVFEERIADNDLLVEGQRNLQDYFQSRGYYDASVEFRVAPPENDLEIIRYAISMGQRFKVVHVGVAGNRYFDAATIRERMFIQPAALNLRRGASL
jgi:outer membrane protein assembly factor BamA